MMALGRDRISSDALEVVRRLQHSGFVTYLVGGCVRDLMVGMTPKDFDIATEAFPEDLKRVFGRRCRIIGRRFKLAHVRSGPSLLEVATFRGRPEEQETAEDESGFVVRANTFGTPQEDALSRDFTINGLFYDPLAEEVIDFVEGKRDIAARIIRTIGDPVQRFREDPVRILRAVKFAARLGFDLDPALREAAREQAEQIESCPVPRVTEEVFRILESGHARVAVALMEEIGVLDVVLGELARIRDQVEGLEEEWLRWLGRLDRFAATHGPLPRASTYVITAWPLVWDRIQAVPAGERRDWGEIADEATGEMNLRMGIPIRNRQLLRGTARTFRRLLTLKPDRRLPRATIRSPSLPVALTLLRYAFVDGREDVRPVYERTAALLEHSGVFPAPIPPRSREDTDEGPTGKQRGKRRRPRRRRPRGGHKEP